MDSSWEFVISAALLILIARNYQAAIYYAKFFYVNAASIFCATILIPFHLLRPRNVENLLTYGKVTKHISHVIGLKWHLRGAENFAKDRTCVFVANHQTSLDVLGMFYVWHIAGKMTAIAKRELLYVGLYGVSMWLAGLFFIDRKAGAKAIKAMNDAMGEYKRKNIKLLIFPEGTRRNTGEIHQFKKGAFHTAVQAQVPIVPVVFSSYKLFLDDREKTFGNGEVIITAMPEISTKGLTSSDVDDLIQKTRDAMIQVYEKSTKEAEMLLSTDEC